MNAELRESLYDLYEIGGLELLGQGSGGSRRELLLDLETSALGLSGFPCVGGHNGQEGVPLCPDARNR